MDPMLEQALFANEAFYLAFEAKDFSAMDNVWSSADEITCVHPGWRPLVGRKAVMESWQAILNNPQQAQVSFFAPTFQRIGEHGVAVVCFEETAGAAMVATNVFVSQDDRMRMIVHHAGFCTDPPANDTT